jgi:hypothetical protein
MNGFRRGFIDVLTPALAVVACIILWGALSSGDELVGALKLGGEIKGHVVGVNNRAPGSDHDDRFFLEYPVVEYSDSTGKLRRDWAHDGALPGYFHVEQQVALTVLGGHVLINDVWYIWQSRLLYSMFSLACLGSTIYYFCVARPRYIRGSKTPNHSPEPTPGAVH